MQAHRRSLKHQAPPHIPPPAAVAHKGLYHYDASSIMSSDLDTTTFFDTENDDQYVFNYNYLNRRVFFNFKNFLDFRQ